MDGVEKFLLLESLREHGNNKTNAAKTLGITREGLHKKLRQFGIGGKAALEDLGPAQQQRKLRGAIPSRGRAASSLRSSTCKSRPPVLIPQAPDLARSHTARYFLCCCAGPQRSGRAVLAFRRVKMTYSSGPLVSVPVRSKVWRTHSSSASRASTPRS